MRKRENKEEAMTPEERLRRQRTRHLLLLVGNTVVFFALYRVLLYYAEMAEDGIWAFLVMLLYMGLLLGFVLGYLIYNRFFYRKGLLPEQLPAEWSAEQKVAFLADGEARLQKSKWMMTVIFPLVVTFLIDAIDLFLMDFLRA